jgi:hypothetical protein
LNGFATWDGVWYADIARDGYRFDPRKGSHVVFFPMYPVFGWAINLLTGCGVVLALVLFSQFVFLADLWLLRLYVRARFPEAEDLLADQTLLALGLLPGTFWFRMAYSDGLLLLFVLLFLLGLQQKWSLWWLAVIAGAVTGTRAVGVTLSIIWLVEVVRRQSIAADGSPLRTLFRTAGWALLGGPVAIWGVLTFMAHLWWVFGDPMLFTQTKHCSTIWNVWRYLGHDDCGVWSRWNRYGRCLCRDHRVTGRLVSQSRITCSCWGSSMFPIFQRQLLWSSWGGGKDG